MNKIKSESSLPIDIDTFNKRGRYSNLIKYIIDKYGNEIYEQMRDIMIICKYCNQKVHKWDFSRRRASQHEYYCIERILEQERKAVKEGWLIINEYPDIIKKKVIKKICDNCNYSSLRRYDDYTKKKYCRLKGLNITGHGHCFNWKKR